MSLKKEAQKAEAQLLANAYHIAQKAQNKKLEDQALRAYERYTAKIGYDPLV